MAVRFTELVNDDWEWLNVPFVGLELIRERRQQFLGAQ